MINTTATRDQMMTRLMDFHTDRLTRIGKSETIGEFLFMYKNMSTAKMRKDYDEQFYYLGTCSAIENETPIRNENIKYSAALMG
jgi:hypothetical protein